MKKTLLLAGSLLLAGAAQAAQGLSCQVEKDLAAVAGQAPKVTEFTWSTAHNSSDPIWTVKTSIGAIAPGDDLKTVTLEGQSVELPAEVGGLIRFGKVYDYGDRVVLAYRVERQEDASATPSEVVYALDKTRAVTDADILPGSEWEAPDHCVLIP